MGLKLTVQGEPEEIASFFATIEKCECMTLTYHSDISKRASHHKWGSARAGIAVNMVASAKPDVIIYNRRKSKATNKSAPTKGYVYLMPAYDKNGVAGYKIGKTVNPKSRKRTFSVKMPYEVAFLAIISTDDYSALEVALHVKYRHARRGTSEFFDLLQIEISEIIAMMSGTDLITLGQLISQYSG